MMKKKYNVLTINSFFSPVGGAEVIAYNTYKILKNNGFNSYYWATDKGQYFEKDYLYTKYFPKYISGMFDYIRNPIKYYYNYEAKNKLSAFIKEIKPDIIHVHNLYSLTSAVLECCKDIPTVMTIHDTKFICPPATLLYKSETVCNPILCNSKKYINCFKNRCVRNNFEASLRHTIYATINIREYKYVNHFITPSDALRNLILDANIGVKKENITTINNFISESVDKIENNNNQDYFLYIGRLSKEKGIQYLVEALMDLPKEIELRIVGSGSEEINLKKIVKENEMNNIKFVGYKNREEIKNEYQNCIATILPCNWFENFPTTNMESFIHGKPVIASNIGGIPEQVEHDKTGLLFEPANITQLKECILEYWNNRNLAKEHGKNAYKKASIHYTEARYYDELLNIYNELLMKYAKK